MNPWIVFLFFSFTDDSEYVDPFNPPNLDTGNAFPNYDYEQSNDYNNENSNDYNKDYTNNIGDYEDQYDAPDYGSQQQTIEANSRVGLVNQQPEVSLNKRIKWISKKSLKLLSLKYYSDLLTFHLFR